MDIRLYSTRLRMVAGMIACMKQKPFRMLKDTDIISASGVSPRTFYHYYKDRNELLDLLEKQLLIDLKEALQKDFETLASLEHIPNAQDIYKLADPAFKHVCAYCERNQEVGQVLLSDNGDIKFAREIERISALEFNKRAKYLAGKKELEINDPVFAKAYVSQIVSLIENWLLLSDKVAPKRVRELIGKVQVTSPFEMLKEKTGKQQKIENA
jgi:AcrR family transcriptional regulator